MPRTRLRADYVFGTLTTSGGINTTATAIAGAELARLPAVSSDEFAPLIFVDPSTGAYEIAYVTAHTASATSATIVRGREGTAGQTWVQDATWIHGPTAADIGAERIDAPWADDLGYDLEFDDGYSTSLPSGYAWVNQGTSTWVQQQGAGLLTPQRGVGADNGHRLIVRTIPTESTWEWTAKVGLAEASALALRRGGLVLRDSVSGKYIAFTMSATTTFHLQLNLWSAAGVFNSPTISEVPRTGGVLYMRIQKTGSTTYTFSSSPDGIAWAPHTAAYSLTYFTPDQIGFIANAPNTTDTAAAFHWSRIR